ncbi:hypothetical protein PsYK624_012270 [Phanerochaete sordida]|uniref:Uncharacterized protein n=1 Tax=Phanerochaete sordida TaxID=48140 RepID=A0A9P3L847_9APHY|nr:hypothetical protein PsYK624_012270 [Phanerochaete sordida]
MVSAIQADAADPAIQTVTPVATQTLQLVEAQVDKLVSTSQILTNALEDLARIHPVVSSNVPSTVAADASSDMRNLAVVVLAFKTALKFEMARRENDRRVLLVRTKMNDMLSVLLIIRPIAREDRAEDGKTIESRIGGRIESIAEDIKKYATLCDGFLKKRKLVKLIRSLEWEAKLESYIKVFDGYKQALQDDLVIYTSHGVHQANETLAKISSHFGSAAESVDTLLLLQALRSPADRDLLSEINQLGGAGKVLNDKDLMQKLLEKNADKEVQGDAQVLNEVIYEFSKSFADMVQENEELFNRKFDAWQQALQEEMKTIVVRESDRVIGAFTAGPHDRIVDKDLYEVWKEAGWKGTTEARSLVLSLREHYAERLKIRNFSQHQALEAIYKDISTSGAPGAVTGTSGTTVIVTDAHLEDEWALEFITIARIQPLLEAFDDDASSLVSVSEVNAFTGARPASWSLLKWMAYWTAGFPLSLCYYFRRIPIFLVRIGVLAKQVREIFPDNRLIVEHLVNDYLPWALDLMLAGVYPELEESIFDWDDELFDRFRDYVDEEEDKMEKKLISIKYCIDAQDTLEFVTGSTRIEKNLLPLLYLLLRRAWNVLRHARQVALDPRELTNIVKSLQTINLTARARADHLIAICKLQNLDPKEHLRKFSYGIYYYFRYNTIPEIFKDGEYMAAFYLPSAPKPSMWPFRDIPTSAEIDFSTAKIYLPEIVIVEEDQPPGPLCYPTEDLVPRVEVYDDGDARFSLIFDGHFSTWTGSYSAKQYDGSFSGSYSTGAMFLDLPPNGDSGPFTGWGIDGEGRSVVAGTLRGASLVCDIEYASVSQRLVGTLNASRDRIEGVYGVPKSGDLNAGLTDSSIDGGVVLRAAPVRFSYLEPTSEALAANKAKALWDFAIKSILAVVRIRMGRFDWPYLRERRRVRQRFMELFSRLNGVFPGIPRIRSSLRLSSAEYEELGSLAALCSKQDLEVYRNLALILRRRNSVHW